MQSLYERTETPIESSDIWYLHTTPASVFCPTKTQKPTNGNAPTAISALP